MADMPRLMAIAKRYGLIVIEDATEALGTRCTDGPFAGKFAGTISDIGCYSFNGNKIITTGAGGMVVSNHADWAEHAKHLSTQAKTDLLQFLHDEFGYNYRRTNVQASLGLAQLERLEGFIAHKKALYDRYVAALDGVKGLRILPFREGECRSNRWFFSLYLKGCTPTRACGRSPAGEAFHTKTAPRLLHRGAVLPILLLDRVDNAVQVALILTDDLDGMAVIQAHHAQDALGIGNAALHVMHADHRYNTWRQQTRFP